ncbi:MAG: hypothetical protein RUDDFDWM_001707 [Candidatus Fervidibacterota bacterium]
MACPKVGVIGLGRFGINHLRCYRQLSWLGLVELVAACDVNEELLEARMREFHFTPYTDYKEMLENEELNAVSVATPDHLHRQIVIDCIEAGVNVLCEKPLDVTVDGCIEMVEAARRKNVLLCVDFHKRYDEYHQLLKRKIEAGELGKIQYGYAYMEDRLEVPRDWLRKWAHMTSPAWFLGIHYYDLVRWLLQSNATEVWAKGKKEKLVAMGIDTYDSITAMVCFENGATVCFQTCWILPDEFEATVNQGLRLIGTSGIAECDAQDRGTRTCCETDSPKQQSHNPAYLRLRYDAFGREWWEGYGIASIADFAQIVSMMLDGAKISEIKGVFATGEDGLEATRIAQAIHESAESGTIVKIER